MEKSMPIKTVDAATLKNWLDNNEAIVVDVRDPDEHQAEKIPGSISIPLVSLSKKRLPGLGDKKLVVHCGIGKRGAKACEKLATEDPSLEIYNLEGGISSWLDQGYSVDKGGKLFLPISRQVPFLIGLLVLVFTFLGAYVHGIFLIIPFLLGIVLCYFGWTGDSYLEEFTAKMPWNQSGTTQGQS
jgi:rhodanese-related sulfurtransferase